VGQFGIKRGRETPDTSLSSAMTMLKRSGTDINQILSRMVEESTGISVEGNNPFAVG